MKMKMKMKRKSISLLVALAMTSCLAGCGNTAPTSGGGVEVENVEENKENIESELPDSMDASDVADMLESGMTVDEVIDKVEEIKEEEVAETDKPAGATSSANTATASPAPTETPKPTATPEPTPEPTPTPPPHVHSWTEEVVRQPSCAVAGEKKLTCECGETKTEAIPATGNHSWVEGTTVVHHEALGHVETVQVQVGMTEGRTEYACNYPSCSERFDTPEAKSEHCLATGDFGHAMCSTIAYDYPPEPIFESQSQWIVDQNAWDETVGTGTYTCSVCGATK